MLGREGMPATLRQMEILIPSLTPVHTHGQKLSFFTPINAQPEFKSCVGLKFFSPAYTNCDMSMRSRAI